MATINPNDFLNEKAPKERVKLSDGVKTFIAVGARYGYFKSGTKFLEIGHVCIKSDKGDKEVGLTYYCRFPLSQNSLWRMGQYAASIGYKEVFDPEQIDDIQKVLMIGPLQITLKEGDYGLEAKYFNKVHCKRDQEGFPVFDKVISDLIIKAEQWVNKAFDKARIREEGGGYSNTSSGATTSSSASEDSVLDDEIPF
jgi:hypothetical protein